MTADAPTLEPVAPARTAARGRGRFLLVCALLAAAIGVLLYKGLLSSLDYFDTVDQALAHRAQLGTTSFRLEGLVRPRTIVETTDGTAFTLEGADGRWVRVVNTGSPPALFQPDIPVVVVGHFASPTSIVFDSNLIMVQHTDTYIAQHRARVTAPNGTTR
ncbi:MAG TPA: cytochrome c maturation protein CcmE [Acidimicrobiales bacterium]|nr:cytochrome c maturation protein CcmE [Acidimicrobiales bacterium]